MNRIGLLALFLLPLASCDRGDDHIEYNENGVIKAHKVGTKLVSANLYKHNGRRFEPVHFHQEPLYYIFYYSASW